MISRISLTSLFISLFSLQAASAVPSTIEEIRAEYQTIVEERQTSHEIKFNREEVEGTLTLRYRGGAIRTAVAGYGHEHGGVTISAYYKDGAPFFVLIEEGSWKFVGDGKTEDSVRETRFYIVGGTAIRVLEKSYKGGDEQEPTPCGGSLDDAEPA